jgi:hypothetical protein
MYYVLYFQRTPLTQSAGIRVASSKSFPGLKQEWLTQEECLKHAMPSQLLNKFSMELMFAR